VFGLHVCVCVCMCVYVCMYICVCVFICVLCVCFTLLVPSNPPVNHIPNYRYNHPAPPVPPLVRTVSNPQAPLRHEQKRPPPPKPRSRHRSRSGSGHAHAHRPPPLNRPVTYVHSSVNRAVVVQMPRNRNHNVNHSGGNRPGPALIRTNSVPSRPGQVKGRHGPPPVNRTNSYVVCVCVV